MTRLDLGHALLRAPSPRGRSTICLALAVSVTTWNLSPDFGQRFQTQHFDRRRRLGFADRLAAIVEHGADFAEHRAADEVVADAQRAVAHQDGGHRTAAAVELGFEHGAHGRAAPGLALRSCMSATSRIISSSRSRFVFVLAETGTMTVSPPQSSASRPRSASCCLTRSGWASGLSILLIATMIGTSAALAWSMASSVCGITPSSAATTSTTMSVTLAPRARMRVKASWPGVSRKTILRPFFST